MAFGDDALLVANIDESGRQVEIAVTATGMTHATVYRVVAGDNKIVRGGDNDAVNGPGLWAGGDAEAPAYTPLAYGAEITDGIDTFVVPDVNVVGFVDYGGDYLMPVGQPNLGFNVQVEKGGFGGLVRKIVQDIQPVLNRAAPVVVSYNRRLWENETTLLTLTEAEREELVALLEFPVVMFVARPGFGFVDPLYIALGDVTEERTSGIGSEPSRRWKMKWTQVDKPPADYPYVLVGELWSERLVLGQTWATVKSSYADWYDYAGYPT